MDFRKINIDQYDEDTLLEEELYDPDPRDPATVLADAKQKAAGVRGLLAKYVSSHKIVFIWLIYAIRRSDIAGALSSVLENAPYGPKVDDAKVWTISIEAFGAFMTDYRLASNTANPALDIKLDKTRRYTKYRQGTAVRCSGYSNEVLIQGNGNAGLRRCQQRGAPYLA